MKKIKVAFIATTPFFLISQLKDFLDYLNNDGKFEIYIFTTHRDSFLSDYKRLSERFKIYPIRLDRNISILSDIFALFKLIYYFITLNIDIIHSFTPKGGLIASLAGFISFRKLRIHSYTGQPWVTKTGFLKKIMIFSDWLIGKLCTISLTDSKSQMDFLIKKKIINSKKIQYLLSGSIAGVNFDRFNYYKLNRYKQTLKQKFKVINNHKVIIFLGRIHEDKGIFELMDTFNKLSKILKLQLFIVGPYDFTNFKSLLKFKKYLNLNKKIIRIDYTEQPEELLSISDILCLPSLREGFGSSIIQASALKVPAIASNIDGIKDAILNNRTGFLYDRRNKKNLEKMLINYFRNFYNIRFIKQKGFLNVKKKFNCELIFKEYTKVYLNNFK